MNEFGKHLKELRKEKNLNIAELSKNIGYSKSIISYWENGQKEPTLSALIALSKFFEVSLDSLIDLDYNFGYINSVSSDLTAEERQFVADFRALNASGQKLVKDVIKNLQAGSRAADQGANTVNSATNKRA